MPHNRWLARAALASLALGLFGSDASAADTYDGAAFTLLAHQAVDVTRQQQQLQQGSLNLDETPLYFYFTGRSAPARFRFETGQTAPGGLTRLQLGMGGGIGKPRSEAAFAVGLLVDGGYATQFPNLFKANEFTKAAVTQGLFFANVSAHGLSFSAGAQISSTVHLKGNGELGEENAVGRLACCRSGAPPAATNAVSDDTTRSTSYVFSTRHASGVGLGAATAQLATIGADGKLSQKRTLAALLARVQPETLFRQYGLFLIGVDRLAPEVDYYAERYVLVRDARAAGRAASLPAVPTAATYEIPVGVDNLLHTGVRVRIVSQVAPAAKARLFELGEVRSFDLGSDVEIDAGVRGVVFSRNDAYVPSVDVFAGLRLLGRRASWTFSYSYNSPDSLTFFPVPNAHAVGFQVVYGPLEVAQPLVPFLGRDGRPKPERNAGDQ